MSTSYLFTDGSSRGNPGPGGFGFVYVYDFKQEKFVVEGGGRSDETTNNRMELSAVIFGLQKAASLFEESPINKILIVTDSGYVLNGAKSWIHQWKRNGWITSSKTPVSNKDLWMELDELKNALDGKGVEIVWHQVKGHADVSGNERCDEIATSFADNVSVELFQGPLHAFPVQLVLEKEGDVSFAQNVSNGKRNGKSKKSRNRGPAFSYVSKVKDKIQVHKDWESCKECVHGKAAKFKRVESKEEEEALINLWSRE